MIVNHNMTALNAHRNLQKSNHSITKSVSKLSSGLQVNQAADDVAGLSISEKMKGQIRGLEKAKQNIADGISLIQVGESAMGEIQELLQRSRELAVQSSNDTNTSADRKFIQNEVSQIVKEIDVIVNNTEFNKMKLLSGKGPSDGNSGFSNSLSDVVQSITQSNGINDTYTIGGTNYASAVIDFSNLHSSNDIQSLVGKGVHYTCATCDKAYSIKFVDGSTDASKLSNYNPVMDVDISSITNGDDVVKKIIETAYGQDNYQHDPANTTLPPTSTAFVKHFSKLGFDGGKLFIFDERPTYAGRNFPDKSGRGKFEATVYGEAEVIDKVFKLDIQAGSNAGQSIRIEIPNLTTKELSIENVSVLSREDANGAITVLDQALSKASGARGSLGSYQNRLEHAYSNNSNYEINLIASESRIRDTDIAKEMMNKVKNDIIMQASQSVLAKASAHPQGILELLR